MKMELYAGSGTTHPAEYGIEVKFAGFIDQMD